MDHAVRKGARAGAFFPENPNVILKMIFVSE
jgi:hypothetical protein